MKIDLTTLTKEELISFKHIENLQQAAELTNSSLKLMCSPSDLPIEVKIDSESKLVTMIAIEGKELSESEKNDLGLADEVTYLRDFEYILSTIALL